MPNGSSCCPKKGEEKGVGWSNMNVNFRDGRNVEIMGWEIGNVGGLVRVLS
jgi:hypothetical protein